MFATVLGALPRPPGDSDDDEAVRTVIAAQERAGLEALTDGRLRWKGARGPLTGLDGGRWRAPLTVDAWRFAQSCSQSAVKQTLPGPYSLGRRLGGSSRDRRALTLRLAGALHEEVRALAAAGCPLVEIDEPDAVALGDAAKERRLFIEAHHRLTGDTPPTHLSLLLTAGNVVGTESGTFLDVAYASYAVDLIAGPDNWRFVVDIPGDRGVVVGALGPAPDADDSNEVLVWAAHYAAASGRRGLQRVGIANAPGLDAQDWGLVERKLARLGEAATLAAMSGEPLAGRLDPRAVDSRSAALGRYEPRRRP